MLNKKEQDFKVVSRLGVQRAQHEMSCRQSELPVRVLLYCNDYAPSIKWMRILGDRL